MYDEFFTKANELREKGVPFATATVVRAEKPTSGKPGDKAIVTLDGVMYGWIGGSCAQPQVVQEALRAIADDRCRLLRLSPEPGASSPRDGIEERAMTCFSGGTLDIHIEPQQPVPRLLVVGHLPVARSLVHLGRAMSYRTLAIDPEQEGGTAMAHADLLLDRLEDLSRHVTPLSYVVVATHGHFDEEAVASALASGAPYVGLVASRKRGASVREELRRRGFDDADLERLRAPAGLDIQARRGDEIALSILAEIVQERRNAEIVAWPTAPREGVPATEESGREEAGPVESVAKKGGCCGGGDSA